MNRWRWHVLILFTAGAAMTLSFALRPFSVMPAEQLARA